MQRRSNESADVGLFCTFDCSKRALRYLDCSSYDRYMNTNIWILIYDVYISIHILVFIYLSLDLHYLDCSSYDRHMNTNIWIHIWRYDMTRLFTISSYLRCRALLEQSQSVTSLAITEKCPPAPMNHVKYLRAGPTEMPFQNWYTANTNHFRLTDSVRWKSKRQLGWVINPVPHNLVRRIRFWRIKISGTWF